MSNREWPQPLCWGQAAAIPPFKKRHGTEREELTLCGGGRQNPSPGHPPQKPGSAQWMLYLTGAVVFVPSVHEGRSRWEWAHWALFIYYTLCRGVYSFFSVWRHRSSSYWPINLAFWPPAKTSSLSSKLAVVRKERRLLSALFFWARLFWKNTRPTRVRKKCVTFCAEQTLVRSALERSW